MATRYQGNAPSNVSKDAKYSATRGVDGWQVRLIYRLSAEERALITTSAHLDLVELVNGVKQDYNGSPGGAFYIDEYRHVLVPTEEGCMFADYYRPELLFRFEGRDIGPRAEPGLSPGAEWTGPRVGIPYTLTADGRDVRYETETRPNVIAKRRLSQEVGSNAAERLAQDLARYKPGGGRIYINEACEFFAPVQRQGEWTTIYLGSLGTAEWFADTIRGSSSDWGPEGCEDAATR